MKISKYTYMVDSEKNEVIFYNARIGYNSICKLNKSEFSEVFNNGKFAEVDTKVINFFVNYIFCLDTFTICIKFENKYTVYRLQPDNLIL